MSKSMYLRKPPIHVRGLPRGCELCLRGLKSVLFITGLCPVGCFYCPVNPERRQRDLMYINDIQVRDLRTILLEVERCLSRGIAITGGEPLVVIDRVLEICKVLKMFLGEEFHIHIYTNVAVLNKRRAELLAMCPVDEVRLHVLEERLISDKTSLLKFLARQHFDVGLETPVLPGLEKTIMDVVELLYHNDVISFVNLNEVDVSSGNEHSLRKLGYIPDVDGTVQGSYEAGRRLLNKLSQLFPNLKINLCTSCTKDIVQVGLRYFYKSFTMSTLSQRVEDDGSVTSTKIGNMFRHPGNHEPGQTYRFIPRLSWFEIFEIT